MKSAIFKTLFLSLCIIANTTFLYAQTASILPQGYTQYLDNNGKPLTSGKVFNYIPSTTTFKTTWQDSGETIANTNPVILDAGGRAKILGDGNYRQIVKDRSNNIIWDAVTSSSGSGGGGSSTATGDGDLVGTIKPWAGMTAPNQYAFTYGQEISRTTYATLFTAITSSQAIFCTSGSAVLNGLTNTTNFWVGMTLEVSCIAAGNTTIISKTSSSVTMAVNANTTANTTAIFYPWGRGNGSTTFNLPDFRGFTIVGNTIMGGVASSNLTISYFGATPDSSGASGGNQNTTLAPGNLPPHTHTSSTLTDPGHFHTTTPTVFSGGGGANMAANSTGSVGTKALNSDTKTTDITISASTGTNATGFSTPISRVQPSKTANYIIKITPDTNSATASGVTSLGNMVGDIACGSGITCTGNIISASISSNEIVFNTLTDAAAATIAGPTSPATVRTLGRSTVGDYGAGSYVRIGASTAAAYRFQSADGQWWALNNRIITPEQLGCFSGSDCTAAFTEMSTLLQSASSGGVTNGGLIVNFKPGADYQIWPLATTPGFGIVMTGTSGITFNFNGAQISTNNTWVAGNGSVFTLSNTNNIIFNDPKYTCTSCSGAIDPLNYGIMFFITDTAPNYSYNIQINNAYQNWGSAFVLANGNSDGSNESTAHNISVVNADLSNVFYGLSFQNTGDNVFVRNMKCTNCGRPYFPYGVNNHDIEIIRNGGGSGFVSALLASYGQPKAGEIRKCLCNIKLNIRDNNEASTAAQLVQFNFIQSVAEVTVSGAANNGGGLIRLTVNSTTSMLTGQQWHADAVGGVPNATGNWLVTVIDATHVDLQASTFGGAYTAGGYMRVPSTMRDVNVHVESALATSQPVAISTGKYNFDSTPATNVNGLIMTNVDVSGTLRNWNYGVTAISLFLNNAISVGTFTGETIRNFSLKDLIITGTNSAVLIDATPITSNLILENIYTTTTSIPWTITGASSTTRILNVDATNVTNRNGVVPSTAGAGQFATGISNQGVVSYGTPAGLTVGTTTIASGTSNGVIYDNAGVIGNTAAGTSGQIFAAVSGVPSFATTAATQGLPSDPSTTTNTTGLMMGLGSTCAITPAYGTKIRISWEGNEFNSASTNSGFTIMRFGTGSAPANAAAATGTTIGKSTGVFHGNPSSSVSYSFSRSGIITGLTPGTAYWFDLQLGVVTSGTVGVSNMSCSINEF